MSLDRHKRPQRDVDVRVAEVVPEPELTVQATDVLRRAAVGAAIIVGVLLTVGVVGTIVSFDGIAGDAEADLVAWVAENRTGVLDTVASVTSALSDTWMVIGVLVGAVSMLWVGGHPRAALTVFLGVSIDFAAFIVVGTAIDRARPSVEALHSVPSTSSFPSGHTAAAFVLYGSLILVARSVLGRRASSWSWLLAAIVAALVGAARIYEGVHYPSDVAGGLVLGVLALTVAGRSAELLTLNDRLDAPFRWADRYATGPTSRGRR